MLSLLERTEIMIGQWLEMDRSSDYSSSCTLSTVTMVNNDLPSAFVTIFIWKCRHSPDNRIATVQQQLTCNKTNPFLPVHRKSLSYRLLLQLMLHVSPALFFGCISFALITFYDTLGRTSAGQAEPNCWLHMLRTIDAWAQSNVNTRAQHINSQTLFSFKESK